LLVSLSVEAERLARCPLFANLGASRMLNFAGKDGPRAITAPDQGAPLADNPRARSRDNRKRWSWMEHQIGESTPRRGCARHSTHVGCWLQAARRQRTVGHDAFAWQRSILLASLSTSTARTGQPRLTWLLVSRPETRAVWVLCWHQPPKRARRNMFEPSFAGVNLLPSRNFYLFSHAIRNLTSHPR
jgi:hypothetical protein